MNVDLNNDTVQKFIKYSDISKEFEELKKHLEEITLSTSNKDYSPYSVLELIEKFCELKRSSIPNIHSQFGSLIKSLKVLEESMNTTLYPIYISDKFWLMFKAFMYDKRQLSMNTIKKNIHQLKQVLRYSSLCNVSLSPTAFDVKTYTSWRQKLTLSPEEIAKIYYFDYKKINRRPQYRKTLIKAKDMLILSCNLYQRYKDMQRITAENFSDNGTVFTTYQSKTGNIASLNINDMSVFPNITYEILERYNYTAPYKGDISNYEKYIKDIIKICGLDNMVSQVVYENKKMFFKNTQRSELISSHTARRTAITIAVNSGKTNIRTIMRASGHKTVDQFEKYIQQGIYSIKQLIK